MSYFFRIIFERTNSSGLRPRIYGILWSLKSSPRFMVKDLQNPRLVRKATNKITIGRGTKVERSWNQGGTKVKRRWNKGETKVKRRWNVFTIVLYFKRFHSPWRRRDRDCIASSGDPRRPRSSEIITEIGRTEFRTNDVNRVYPSEWSWPRGRVPATHAYRSQTEPTRRGDLPRNPNVIYYSLSWNRGLTGSFLFLVLFLYRVGAGIIPNKIEDLFPLSINKVIIQIHGTSTLEF